MPDLPVALITPREKDRDLIVKSKLPEVTNRQETDEIMHLNLNPSSVL